MQRKGYNITNQYGLYFVTFTTVGWVDIFTRKECVRIIMDALKYCIANKGLVVCSYVVMTNHLHLIIRAKKETSGLSDIIRDFKKFTSNQIIKWVRDSGRESRKEWLLMVFRYHAKYNKRNVEFQVWKQHNQPKELIHPKFTMQKLRYIHENPVRAGFVDKPDDYLHSSARNYMGRSDYLLEVELIDFGGQEGYLAL